MAGGILFPDIGRALSAGASAAQGSAQLEYLNEDRETGKYFGAALQGDKDAQARVMSNPKYAGPLFQHLDRIEVGKRAKVKEDADYITSNGMAILNAAPEQQPSLYARVRQEAQASGRDVSTWPEQYNPSWIKFNVDKAMSVKDHYDRQNSGPQAMPPPGGGGAAPGGFTGQVAKDESGGNYNIPNAKGSGAYGKYQFMPDTWASVSQANPQLNLPMNIRQATPQQQEAAMEAFTRSNGQALVQAGQPATPANLYLAHRFGTQGATRFLSTPDNTPIAQVFPANWIQQNPDLNTTVGQFKRSVQSRYGGMPVGREVDIATNAAPMPEPPPGMAAFGNPAQMPGGPSGAPPGMAVGDTRPQADASGNALPPPQQAPGAAFGQEFDDLRTKLRATGGDIYTKGRNGEVEVQNGNYVVRSIQNPRQIVGMIPVKPAKDPLEKGIFGDSLPGRALQVLRTSPPDSQDYAIARSVLSKPQMVPDGAGGFTVVQPMDLSMYPPATYGGGGGQPAPSAPAPGGPVTTQIPGGGSMTSIPGKGKPLDNSSRDDLTKASGGVLELTELVKSFDPSFGNFMVGGLGDADNFRKRNLPDMLGGKDEKGQAQWWQRYATFANLERNKLFGAALTPGEAAEFNKAMVNPGMKADEITANLSRQRDVASKALSRVVNSMVASGYNPQAIEAATGIPVADLPSAMGSVPQAQRGATQPPAQGAPKPPADNAERGRLIFDAQKAIKDGRDPVAVRARLKELNIDPAELDAK